MLAQEIETITNQGIRFLKSDYYKRCPVRFEIKKEKPEKYNPAVKPLFKTSRERYGCLMEHGCTC